MAANLIMKPVLDVRKPNKSHTDADKRYWSSTEPTEKYHRNIHTFKNNTFLDGFEVVNRLTCFIMRSLPGWSHDTAEAQNWHQSPERVGVVVDFDADPELMLL
mgnify:CR=1 FL=1